MPKDRDTQRHTETQKYRDRERVVGSRGEPKGRERPYDQRLKETTETQNTGRKGSRERGGNTGDMEAGRDLRETERCQRHTETYWHVGV